MSTEISVIISFNLLLLDNIDAAIPLPS